MSDLAEREYRGDGVCRYEPLPKAWNEPEPYKASPVLIDAVNVALYLRRPLLLEGEPGCGKTRLAYSIAYELGFPLYECYIRSTSRAQDLLYDYDALGRLYDVQESKVDNNKNQIPSREKYLTLQALGEAIKDSQNDVPSVVLIDEIDKADIDFPNDLLLELDRLQFNVKEVPGKSFDALKGKSRKERRDSLPLIIVTSNREKELPKPFLRRCLFCYVKFPDQKILLDIVNQHFRTGITPLFEVAIVKFWELKSLRSWRKDPGTSEFLDWLMVLERAEKEKKISAGKLKKISIAELPHLETLIKTQSDRDTLARLRVQDV
ncbi:MoxR family ATPase [Trichocoleus desertorum AS-A10]|uniref:AAA family ATPase n=1 Tax=Trichocoleus desertorum TaxID=1481672 RepID=UPI00329728A5